MSIHAIETNSVVIADNLKDKATSLSEQLQLPIVSIDKYSKDLWLDWIEEKKHPGLKLSLCSNSQGSVNIDFLSGKKAHRRQFGGGKGQPLVRAMGQLENGLPTIIDATAGMGGDSFVLATQGFQVQMLERSPIVAALLEDALQRAQAAELDSELLQSIKNLSLVNANSADYLTEQQPEVDVVYMDPMYPEKKKKAAAKKEMQALQQLIGPDLDSQFLLDAALQTARFRVVVKRPKGAAPVENRFNIQPTTNISSPNTRYDIYVIKAIQSLIK